MKNVCLVHLSYTEYKIVCVFVCVLTLEVIVLLLEQITECSLVSEYYILHNFSVDLARFRDVLPKSPSEIKIELE